jgi:hypothetical protein
MKDPSQDGVVAKFNLIYVYALKQWFYFINQAGLDKSRHIAPADTLNSYP